MSLSPAIAFVEQRTYQLAAGKTAEYFKLYETQGLPVQLPILEHLLGYFSTETGSLNTVVHLWGFRSHDERDARRARLQAHPDWRAYWAQVQPLVLGQQSVLLKPAPFFTTRLADMLASPTTSHTTP